MPNPELPGDNRDDRDDLKPQEDSLPLGYRPDEAWISPFSLDTEESKLTLFSEFSLHFPKPIGWTEEHVPREDTRLLLMSPEGSASLVIGAGFIPQGSNIKNFLANTAATPISGLTQHGAKIPVVVSIPTISSIEGVDASHMLNFPATLPGSLVGSNEAEVHFFKHTSVLAIGDKWVSFETSSWGPGCNPATETEIMSQLHMGLQVTKHK